MARTATRKSRRPRYSAEQRAAAAARDAHAEQLADALCADPAAFGARVAGLLPAGGSKLLSYSLRNQALLIAQAEDRAMPLREVDTLRGWRERGRSVRKGEHGLRIVRPVGREGEPAGDETAETITTAQPATLTENGADSAAAERVRFRFMSVFELSQTEGIEDFEGETRTVADDPAALLFAALKAQAERAGYEVTEWPGDEPHTDPVSVCSDSRTISVYADGTPHAETLAQLAAAVTTLATLTTRPGAPHTNRPTEPAEQVMTLTVA